MQKRLLLFTVIIISAASIKTPCQSTQSPTLVYSDFSIKLPQDWVTTRVSDGILCGMEGMERKDGAKPRLFVEAIADTGQTNAELKALFLSRFSTFNIIAQEEETTLIAHQNAYRIELKYRLQHQPDSRLEQVIMYTSWFAIRVASQKKIYLLRLMDIADDLFDGLKSASPALQSFKPTH